MEVNNLLSSGGGVSLPEDIIFDVLARLPAKELCRFRRVCKGWRALISDEALVAAQKSRAAPLVAGVFRSRCMAQKLELRVMDLDGSVLGVFKDAGAFLVPSRLDLVCVDKIQGGAMIIDPAARRVLKVDGQTNYPRIGGTPMASLTHYNLGRAAPSGACKILRLRETFPRPRDGPRQSCEIATVTDCGAGPRWRRRPVPPFITDWRSACKATVNGVLYFMPDNPRGTLRGWNRIATFNLEIEEWTETIDGPAMGLQKEGESWIYALAEVKATLSMLQTVRATLPCQDDDCYTNIWVLTDSKKSIWVKQYRIHMPRGLKLTRILDVLGDGRILFLNSFWKEQNGFSDRHILQYYDPSTEAFTDSMEMAEDFEGAMVSYTGSLLSPILENNHG